MTGIQEHTTIKKKKKYCEWSQEDIVTNYNLQKKHKLKILSKFSKNSCRNALKEQFTHSNAANPAVTRLCIATWIATSQH